ncbi:MAG: hypothetical protein MZV63_27065 [Marinilabiliales bacterium]|nr:hypothetical protein [Marinilabiliales bacterium]
MHNQIASTAYPVAQMRQRDVRQPLRPEQLDHGLRPLQPGGAAGRRRHPAVGRDRPVRHGGHQVRLRRLRHRRRQRGGASWPPSPRPSRSDRRLYWGSEERGRAVIGRFRRDPRVQTENTGAERVEATRLGVANLLRSLDAAGCRAPAATHKLYRVDLRRAARAPRRAC